MLKKGDTIPGIFSMLVGVLTLFYIFQNPKMVILGGTDGSGVGPGLFPFISATALIIFGIMLTLRSLKQKEAVDYFKLTDEKRNNLKKVVILSVFIMIFLIAWKISRSFFVIIPIYVFAVNKLLKRSTKFSLIFTIGITAFIYGLFSVGFSIRFMP